jgi:hypothetical protein
MTIDVNNEMAELTCAPFAIDQPPALHNGAADPSANRQHDDIAKAASGAQSSFADQSHAAVVHNRHGLGERSRNAAL